MSRNRKVVASTTTVRRLLQEWRGWFLSREKSPGCRGGCFFRSFVRPRQTKRSPRRREEKKAAPDHRSPRDSNRLCPGPRFFLEKASFPATQDREIRRWIFHEPGLPAGAQLTLVHNLFQSSSTRNGSRRRLRLRRRVGQKVAWTSYCKILD